MFKKKDSNLIMGIYVDDGILIADESTEIEAILKELNTEFKMSVIKKPKTFVELEINKEDKRVKLTQVDYIKRTLEQYGMENAKPVKTPILKGEDTTPTTKDFPYRQLIESLLYLSTKKRPDISFAVNFGSRYINEYSQENVNDVKHTFKYLNGNIKSRY